MYQANGDVLSQIARILREGVEPEYGFRSANNENMLSKLTPPTVLLPTNPEFQAISRKLDTAASHLVAVNEKIAGVPDLSKINSGFVFGRKSEAELVGVKPELVQVVRLALLLSTIDFTLYDGLRTPAEQQAYLARGTTTTLKSKHLVQSDGFGWAVDCVPVVDGLPKWDWEGCYRIALAMDQAATHLGFADSIRWGGAWDRTLADFGSDVESYKKEVLAYTVRHPGKDFVDGPHFEWVA